MLNRLLEHPESDTVELLGAIQRRLNRVVLGKEHAVRLCLCCILARGHLLIEDHPGLGKTTLAQALARVLGLDFSRIQFTSDMLPADVVGVSVYDPESRRFNLHRGPIFHSVVLADEINRASPKAQSALLEAMAEGQVSNEGRSRELPAPFFVIATQNPYDHSGAFPLPESQLDRFTMTLSLGYPRRGDEQALLEGRDRRILLKELTPETDAAGVLSLQSKVDEIHVSDAVTGYVLDILAASRDAEWIEAGLSPRAGLALLQSARAWALLEGREAVLPEDVQRVAAAVTGHRVAHNVPGAERERYAARLIESVALN